MGYIADKIHELTKQIYPGGRAFKMPFGGYFEKLSKGLATTEEKMFNDALTTFDSILPDNNNFTVSDATDWERRLGLITNGSVSLSNRKLAIIRKLNYPSGSNKAKGHYLYIQSQLQLAGFNVYVHENVNYLNPTQVTGSNAYLKDVQHGDIQHGVVQHGKNFSNKIVNSLDENIDTAFNIGNSLAFTFYISGQTFGTSATVPVARKTEFRELVLKLKPAHTVAFYLINFV